MPVEPTSYSPSESEPDPTAWRGTARYEVLRCIGRGGMGVVYEAFDRERQQRVALKTLLNSSPAALYLFKQEFRTLADVHHRNLVQLHELVVNEGERILLHDGARPRCRLSDACAEGGQRRRGRGDEHDEGRADAPRAVGRRDDRLLAARGAVPRHACTEAFDRRSRALAPGAPSARRGGRGPARRGEAAQRHQAVERARHARRSGRAARLRRGHGSAPASPTRTCRRDPRWSARCATWRRSRPSSEEPTPASDWYSVGVMLYEALVGSPPFTGSSFDVLKMKSMLDPAAPSECVDGVPEDLDGLASALLQRAPELRPSGAEILSRLGAPPSLRPTLTSSSPAEGSPAIVGRETQLAALRDAFDGTRTGRAITVLLGGPSGMGKSTVVQHFLDALVERGEAVVLARSRLRAGVGPLQGGRQRRRRAQPAPDAPRGSRGLGHAPERRRRARAALSRPAAGARASPACRSRSPAIPQRIRRRAFVALRELLAIARRGDSPWSSSSTTCSGATPTAPRCSSSSFAPRTRRRSSS